MILKKKWISILVGILGILFAVSGVLTFILGGAPKKNPGTIAWDTDMKSVVFFGNNYQVTADYQQAFNISSIRIGENNYEVADTINGIHTAMETTEESVTSLSLAEDPNVEVDGNKAIFRFSDGVCSYVVQMTAYEDTLTMKFDRKFEKNAEVLSQSFPGFIFDKLAFENIRWLESGSNYWIGGMASSLTSWLSAGVGYDPENNTRRAMMESDVVLLSDFESCAALRLRIDTEDEQRLNRIAVETDRSTNNYRNLTLDCVLSNRNEPLKFLSGDETYGWKNPASSAQYQGIIANTGDRMFQPIAFETGDSDSVTVSLAPDEFDKYYDLGELKGLNEQLLSQSINNLGRMGILGKNIGVSNMDTNYFVQLPALEYHWLTNLYSILNDTAALESIKTGLRTIRDQLIDSTGHILSPYPGSANAGWGAQYSDMQYAYVLAVANIYAVTGDSAFLEEMRPTIEKVMDYALYAYFDEKADLIINFQAISDVPYDPSIPHSGDPHPDFISAINDYWERSAGAHNGYLTAMAYDALTHIADLEKLLYRDSVKSDYYQGYATRLKTAFNKPIEEGGLWSEQTKSFYYGTDCVDYQHLPTQSAVLKTDIVSNERKAEIVKSLEASQSNLNLSAHVFNVREMRDINRTASNESSVYETFLGMNGGWYGAPDGDYYSGLPYSGDRSLLPFYINKYAENFNRTGFIGATAYMRDMVTPADYGWYSFMSLSSYPVYGLYAYGYGFQPEIDRLNIAPYIDESMVGSRVFYTFRGVKYTVDYNGLYSFTVDAPSLPTDIFVRFLNQTPGQTYRVSNGKKELNLKADSNGVVEVKVSSGKSTYSLLNPDDETVAEKGTNLMAGAPIRPSSTLEGTEVPTYWAENMADGTLDGGYWAPNYVDFSPNLILQVGSKIRISSLNIYWVDSGRYALRIYGSDDLAAKDWVLLDDRSEYLCKTEGSDNLVSFSLKENYKYYKIEFLDSPTKIKIREVQIIV